jgi:hypothetical protein
MIRKRPVAALLAAATVGIGTAAANAATTPAASGAGTFVNGGGTVGFSFDASGVGPDATGSMTIEDHGTLTGHIACLAIHGNEAMVQAQIDSSPIEPGHAGSVGNYIYLDVTDSPGGDSASVAYGSGTATSCFPSGSSYPLTSGDVALAGGDTTPPDISAGITGPLGNAGWYTGDVQVAWTLSEPESWIWGKQGCADADVVTDGQTTLSCAASSSGGRVTKSVTIRRDATPPTVSGAADRAPNANGWYGSDVLVRFACHDALSGVASCPTAVTIGEGSNQSASGTATDVAGNSAGTSVAGLNVDETAPTIAAAPDRAPNANGWYDADVVIGFVCGDALSGVASCTKALTLGEGVNQSASGTATDLAENSAGTSVHGVNVDETAPTIAAAPDRAPNANGWYDADVAVGFTCGDALSGVVSCPAAVTVGEGANQSVSRTTTDRAGNTAHATVDGLNVDETAPVVTIGGNGGSYTIADDVAISCSATDALSGIADDGCADVNGPAWTFGLGTTKRSVTVTDRAGNATTATVSFTVTADAHSLAELLEQQLPAGLANSLGAKVKSGQVNAFDHEVDAQTGKAIDPALAVLLKEAAAGL